MTKGLKNNPTPSSDVMTKSTSTSFNSLLEETFTFDNSFPELETFCFDLEEISSSSTTTHSDISLLEYEAFYDDHVKEISSGSTTTHSYSSLYDSFIFDLSINPFPPAVRSDFYEFADELAHIISPPDMGDEHLDTILATESDEFIKSSVENLDPIPSESEGIPDNMCDVPFHDNSSTLDISKDQFKDFFDFNDDSTSYDDDSFSMRSS
nr:hypothetical protein [Tanacetum cinerariifolium]